MSENFGKIRDASTDKNQLSVKKNCVHCCIILESVNLIVDRPIYRMLCSCAVTRIQIKDNTFDIEQAPATLYRDGHREAGS